VGRLVGGLVGVAVGGLEGAGVGAGDGLFLGATVGGGVGSTTGAGDGAVVGGGRRWSWYSCWIIGRRGCRKIWWNSLSWAPQRAGGWHQPMEFPLEGVS
jgi:hypothetical protein